MQTIDGLIFSEMVKFGAVNLRNHVKEVNALNVFPIPDGDTGENMLMTVMGGVCNENETTNSLCEISNLIASKMLLSARGNSGVILSQFFEGLSIGFYGLETADAEALGKAFECGVKSAYGAVKIPTEGTILTVMREAAEYACKAHIESAEEFLEEFLEEAKRSLEKTPELLPILKKSGVIDSGGAGFIYIIEGMLKAVRGEQIEEISDISDFGQEVDFDTFNEDSILEFGYCTELLLRLQTSKTDISTFDISVIDSYLQTIGDSIVTVLNGSIVKIHVHTMKPQKVLDFCQAFGEFLKVKIENMSLQHNNILSGTNKNRVKSERKKYGVVAVAGGSGIKQTFIDRDADVIVDGGQSMNPSAEDFLKAFDDVNADVIFVFPNNGNIILAAKQAASLYSDSDVRVIESTNIGEGYASLSMLDTSTDNADIIAENLEIAMEGVITAEISHCIRCADIDGKNVNVGDYIGFAGKELLAVSESRFETVCKTIKKIGFEQYDICILFCGKDSDAGETEEFERYFHTNYSGKELYIIDGGQDIYDYIMVIE